MFLICDADFIRKHSPGKYVWSTNFSFRFSIVGSPRNVMLSLFRADSRFYFVLLHPAEQGYSVILPEKLQNGSWNVYRYSYHSSGIFQYANHTIYWMPFFFSSRSSRSPLKLITRFPEHPDIATLHDNFQSVSSTFLVVSKMNSYITKWKCLKSPSSIAITNMRI